MNNQNLSHKGRPIEESSLEIADTFQDSGTRPIEESPDFLVPKNNIEKETIINKTASKIISKHPIVEVRYNSKLDK